MGYLASLHTVCTPVHTVWKQTGYLASLHTTHKHTIHATPTIVPCPPLHPLPLPFPLRLPACRGRAQRLPLSLLLLFNNPLLRTLHDSRAGNTLTLTCILFLISCDAYIISFDA